MFHVANFLTFLLNAFVTGSILDGLFKLFAKYTIA